MSDFTFTYEAMDNIYTLIKKGYTIVRMCREDLNVVGTRLDNGHIQITIEEEELNETKVS